MSDVGQIQYQAEIVAGVDQLDSGEAQTRVPALAASVGEHGGSRICQSEIAHAQPVHGAQAMEFEVDHRGTLRSDNDCELALLIRGVDFLPVGGQCQIRAALDFSRPESKSRNTISHGCSVPNVTFVALTPAARQFSAQGSSIT